jgi:exonuclease SbcD
MKILSTSDWHLGNLFHGNDRLPEHKHFLSWLLCQISEQQPDALLIAGDVFDNGNPSAAAQSAYYEFMADATQRCRQMQIIVIAGNHDSASRLEAPRPLLSRHKVEIRGNVRRKWVAAGQDGCWEFDYEDLIIPIRNQSGEELVVLAVPYLRNDIMQNANYSDGVNKFIRELTAKARILYPGANLMMMAHMYADGSRIAEESSERIVIGGQEMVSMNGWDDHPDYLTCGHIHRRQHIWKTDWARYTGSVLPMSFAEKDYEHGIDMITFTNGVLSSVDFLEYKPQHKLRVLPEDDADLTIKKLKKLIETELKDRTDGMLDDEFDYVVLRVKFDRINNDDIKSLEDLVNSKNAVLCKIQKIMPALEISTIDGEEQIASVDDILKRDPLDALKEAFLLKHGIGMSQTQEDMLREVIDSIQTVTND